jgi:PAS domain S-box-containing protein
MAQTNAQPSQELPLDAALSSEELLSVLDSMDDSFYILDHKWRLVYINESGLTTLGRQKFDTLGKNIWALLPGLRKSEYYRTAHKAVRTKEKAELEEYYPVNRKWFLTKFYPGNNVLLAQARDITELKEAENINDQLNGSLEQAMEVYWSDVNRDKRTKHP